MCYNSRRFGKNKAMNNRFEFTRFYYYYFGFSVRSGLACA